VVLYEKQEDSVVGDGGVDRWSKGDGTGGVVDYLCFFTIESLGPSS
jgi:hypothetical protein